MSSWQDKFVIGLTGNIATGKSVVRRMLEHLGAYGIDADSLAHRVMAKGAPAYQPILDYFGKWVLDDEEQIDRSKLGRIVFADPRAMAKLEEFTHPFVRQAISLLIRKAKQPVIVVEAIKLLEGGLDSACDSIWVTHTLEQTQIERLKKKRNFTEAEARKRVLVQAPQSEKLAAADIVINNEGSFEDCWRQVVRAWKRIVPEIEAETGPVVVSKAREGKLSVQRASPRIADDIAKFITQQSKGVWQMTRTDVMEAFGEKAFMVLTRDSTVVGLIGWQVENLVTRATDFYIDPSLDIAEAAPDLLTEVENASRELQSEASLLFLPPELARKDEVWKRLGYENRPIENLGVRAWQEAARESAVPGTVMLFKQLRKDRVLRPI